MSNKFIAFTDVSQWAKTCHMCGILAPNHCGKCKVVNYCCRVHQVYDWKNGHKDVCGKETRSSNGFLFPEYEIVIENDDAVKENAQEHNLKNEQEIEKYNAMIQDGKAGTFQHEDVNDDLLQMANDEKDETFAKFRMKMDNYPDQILRYLFIEELNCINCNYNLYLFDRYDRGGQILYISSHSEITDIPKCPECNGDRQFEFQVRTIYSYK